MAQDSRFPGRARVENWDVREDEAVRNVLEGLARVVEIKGLSNGETSARLDVLRTRLDHTLWAVSEARTGPKPRAKMYEGYWFWTRDAWRAYEEGRFAELRRDHVLERARLLDYLIDHAAAVVTNTDMRLVRRWLRNDCVICVVLDSQHHELGRLRKEDPSVLPAPVDGRFPAIEAIMAAQWRPYRGLPEAGPLLFSDAARSDGLVLPDAVSLASGRA